MLLVAIANQHPNAKECQSSGSGLQDSGDSLLLAARKLPNAKPQSQVYCIKADVAQTLPR